MDNTLEDISNEQIESQSISIEADGNTDQSDSLGSRDVPDDYQTVTQIPENTEVLATEYYTNSETLQKLVDKNTNYPYRAAMEEAITATFKTLNDQLKNESSERHKLIRYVKWILPVFTLVPLSLVLIFIMFGYISSGIEQLSALLATILAIPTEIILVLKVISDRLFADEYRKSVITLVSQYSKYKN